MIVRLTKQAGMKLVASAGSDDKVHFILKEPRRRRSFKYKTTDARAVLQKEGS
ncbi:hypothetical protein DFH09DRAFT_939864 [Mycena vulgaris]|nr:hypothetical protein DFH09DRAFT_939864 [Mycena vulgaris]